MLDYIDFHDIRDMVFEGLLKMPGKVKEIYDTFHENNGNIKEEDIEWFRKRYTKHLSPYYSFIFIANGEFFVHFLLYGFEEDLDIKELEEYGKENWRGYVDEYYCGDESNAPVFRYAVIFMAKDMNQ